MFRLGDVRFAHTEGLCSLCFSPDSKWIVTSGADGDVRVYKNEEDEDPQSIVVGDEAICTAASTNKVFVSTTGSHTVQAYNISEGILSKQSSVVSRFTADASCIDALDDLVAAGSQDMTAKLVDVESFKQVQFSGHDAPVLSVAIDPLKTFLVTSSCDGAVRVWKMDTGEKEKLWPDLLEKSNDIPMEETRGMVKWHPKGEKLAIAQKDAIRIVDRDVWAEKVVQVKFSSSGESLSSLAWSPDGLWLALGTNKGNVFFYKMADDTVQEDPIASGKGACITAIAWRPNENKVSFIDNRGYWGVVHVDIEQSPAEQQKKNVAKSEENKDLLNEEELAALFDDDDDNENSFSIRQIKKDTGFLSDEDENSNASSNVAPPKSIMDEDITNNLMPPPTVTPAMAPAPPIMKPFEPDLQEPFQSGSTPVHLSNRFLKWNNVGIVRSINSEEESAIEVEFHDTSVHHPIHQVNVHQCTMADLSDEALVLASDDVESTPSRLICHHFACSGSSKEWFVEMPAGEEIMALASSKGWVAVATDRRRCRIFTVGGMQREVLSLPGPVVAVAGHQDCIFIVVHAGMPLMGNQSLSYALLPISNGTVTQCRFESLPLAPCSALAWMGFTDEGSPAIMDTAGQVRLVHPRHKGWVQVCDTSQLVKGKSDHHFLVGISEKEGHLRSILCKGSRYPQTVPMPTVGTYPWSFPLCDAATEKGLLEEELAKKDLLQHSLERLQDDVDEVSDVVKAKNETLIKLFALSCKSDDEARAMEVCSLMGTDTMQIAIKYATKIRRIHLAEKISDLAIQKNESEERERCETPESNADMFETQNELTTDENPFLEAKRKKLDKVEQPIGSAELGTSWRNPFRRGGGQDGGGGDRNPNARGGLVFDQMADKKVASKNSSFGNRVFGKLANAANSTSQGKENEANKRLLKGFQLWLAENRDSIRGNGKMEDSEINSAALQIWKELSKEEKETYKSPRIPKSLKRKREEIH